MADETEYQNTLKCIEQQIKTFSEAGGNECHFGVLPPRIVDLLKDLGYEVKVNASLLGSETTVTW